MADLPSSQRTYTPREIKDLQAAFPATGVARGRGPAYYATGPGWPDELRRRADEAERLAPVLRRAADALEREIGRG